MEKIRVYNYGHTQLKESFYEILKEISEIRPHTTFTKEQEEEFLKDAIVIFEYLKSGIDIKSSEILINNGEIPISGIETILMKLSEKLGKEDSKVCTFHIYRDEEGKPVKIYEFQNNDKKYLAWNSNKLLERKFVSWRRRNILFINSCCSTRKETIAKPQLKQIIDYALKNNIILLYDATSYKDNNGTENVKSIYEIENAKKVAIEFRRFSSVDNGTINCGYLVVPEGLRFQKANIRDNKFFKFKDLLQEEIQKVTVSRKSLKKSFLNYAHI